MSDATNFEAGEMDMLKAMADAYEPALSDAADHKSEDGDRHGSNVSRELANVWDEIRKLAAASRIGEK